MKHNIAETSPADDEPRLQLTRLPAVLTLTDLGRSTIYRWVADGTLPPPVRTGPRAAA